MLRGMMHDACGLMRAAAYQGLDAVVVGADRTVANGDTANKIGTPLAPMCALDAIVCYAPGSR